MFELFGEKRADYLELIPLSPWYRFRFADGSTFDANDVVTSYAVQWDAANPLHKARTSVFEYWSGLFGGFLNPPAP